jgi:hypothetical protein
MLVCYLKDKGLISRFLGPKRSLKRRNRTKLIWYGSLDVLKLSQ